MDELKSFIESMKNSLYDIDCDHVLSSDSEFTLLTFPILSRYNLYDGHFKMLLEILYKYAQKTDLDSFVNNIDKLIYDEFKFI